MLSNFSSHDKRCPRLNILLHLSKMQIWQTAIHRGPENLLILSYNVDFMGLKEIFNRLEVSQAKATVEADRLRILAEIDQSLG